MQITRAVNKRAADAVVFTSLKKGRRSEGFAVTFRRRKAGDPEVISRPLQADTATVFPGAADYPTEAFRSFAAQKTRSSS